MRRQERKVDRGMKVYGHINAGNVVQNPTASIKSYWEPGYRDTPLFQRLVSGKV